MTPFRFGPIRAATIRKPATPSIFQQPSLRRRVTLSTLAGVVSRTGATCDDEYRDHRMKAIQFQSMVTANGQIAVPPDAAREIPQGEQLQVILLWSVSGEDNGWRAVGRRQFEAAYSPEDSIYEQLIDETPIR